MRTIAVDSETALIRPAVLAPSCACITWQEAGAGAPSIIHAADPDAEAMLRAWLEDPTVLLVFHNAAFDMAVFAERFPSLRARIFAAYDADRITDTMIRAQLADIARGAYQGSVSAKGKRTAREYTLEARAREVGIHLQKDAWRYSYGRFIDAPLERWVERAAEVQTEARAALARLVWSIESGEALGADARAGTLLDVLGDPKKAREALEDMIASPLEQCLRYPLEDARATLAVYLAQERIPGAALIFRDQFRQARAAMALHLSSAWGLRTDAEGVARLRASIEAELAEIDAELGPVSDGGAGLIRADGTRDTKAAKRLMVEVCAREGIPVIRTDAHFCKACKGRGGNCTVCQGTGVTCPAGDACDEHICLDGDACERTDDPTLISYAQRTTLAKQLSNDIPALERGTFYPVHTRYGLAGTGRSTSSRPNIQNQSKREGFREAFVPRPGFVFIQCDFPGLELYTWAQFCFTTFGFSDLADALNAGLDPHVALAAEMLSFEYADALARYEADDPAVAKARQQAKPGNFGFAGGMGPPKFVATTRKQMGRKAFAALDLDEARARWLRDKWKARWREAGLHFKRASELTANGPGTVESLFTGRIRSGTTYCATANTPFQGLGADCAKNAAWLIARAEYVGTPSRVHEARAPGAPSPLYNARTVAFVHDEFIAEVRDDAAIIHEAANELADLMAEGANVFLPNVPIPRSKLKPLAMRRWAKKAKPVFDSSGRLVPWAA